MTSNPSRPNNQRLEAMPSERLGCNRSSLARPASAGSLVAAVRSDPTTQQWKEIDQHLSRSLVLNAVRIYLEATGCGVAQAKEAIGTRFRERYPELWSSYRDVPENEQTNN